MQKIQILLILFLIAALLLATWTPLPVRASLYSTPAQYVYYFPFVTQFYRPVNICDGILRPCVIPARSGE